VDTKTASLTVNSSGGSNSGSDSGSSGSGSVTSPVLTASVEATGFSKSVPVAVDGTSGSAKASVDESTLVEAFGKGHFQTNKEGTRMVNQSRQMWRLLGGWAAGLFLPAGMILLFGSPAEAGIGTITEYNLNISSWPNYNHVLTYNFKCPHFDREHTYIP